MAPVRTLLSACTCGNAYGMSRARLTSASGEEGRGGTKGQGSIVLRNGDQARVSREGGPSPVLRRAGDRIIVMGCYAVCRMGRMSNM